jgi:ABC-type antimicrobial peptide transport system permease subunit
MMTINKLRLLSRVGRADRSGMVAMLLIYALAFVVLSVTMFIRTSNDEFLQVQAETIVGCDVQVSIATNGYDAAMPTEAQAAFLDQLAAEGYAINTYRQTSFYLRTSHGNSSFVLRFVDEGALPDSSCILSEKAASKLNLRPGDVLTLTGSNTNLRVASVTTILSPDLNTNNLGIILLPASIAPRIGYGTDGSGYGSFNQIQLFIQISAGNYMDSAQVSTMVERVRDHFPNTNYTRANHTRTIVRDFDQLIGDQRGLMSLISGVVSALSIVAVLISALGVISLQRSQAERRKYNYALLRVNNMTKSDARWFTYIESFSYVVISSIIGIPVGYSIYRTISIQLIGRTGSVAFPNAVFWICVIKCLVLVACLAVLCSRTMIKSLFATDIVVIRQRRAERKLRVFGNLMISALFYVVVITVAFGMSDMNSIVQTFIINLAVVIVALVIYALIYGLFRLLIQLLSKIRINPTNTMALSIRLTLARKQSSSQFAAVLALALSTLLISLNISKGLNDFISQVWTDEFKYNTSIMVQNQLDEDSLKDTLDQEGFYYDVLYRKMDYFENMPDYVNALNTYYVAVLQENPASGVELHAETGVYGATDNFLFLNQMDEGESFTFFGSLQLPYGYKLNALYGTDVFTVETFQALLSYEDAKPYIDSSWRSTLLLNCSNDGRERLARLAHDNDWIIVTSDWYADAIKSLYANYISLIYTVCALLLITVFICVLSLTYLGILHRKREFLVIRVFGAAANDVRKLCILESVWLACLASTVMFAAIWLLFSRIARMLVSSVPYKLPLWYSVGTLAAMTALVSIITMIQARLFDQGRVVDTLREE